MAADIHPNAQLLQKIDHLYGLIGFPLSHSFSKKYFSRKFEEEGLNHHYYELFPLEQIADFPALLQSFPNLQGLNVTIPYKQSVIPFLNELNGEAKRVGAVNTIRIAGGRSIGFNTDIYGFEQSLRSFIASEESSDIKALVFGTGGAAKAVWHVLEKMDIQYQKVSREQSRADLTYNTLDEPGIAEHRLLVNTTPLGMSPHTRSCPDIPYSGIGSGHYLYDLVYNPQKTLFLEKGEQRGAAIQNGLEMLFLQAERAWQIWNDG
ncbi:MAG: shikimate dehydrogenase [Saprospiraceae bacterium]|nr:shikimate dehydrogenase [Saprospiraceae bacterium]